jgi:hypothetical protein
MGRGRDSRSTQEQGQQRQQGQYGQGAYAGRPPQQPYAAPGSHAPGGLHQAPTVPDGGPQQWPQPQPPQAGPGGGPRPGEPEYIGDPRGGNGHDPYANSPGSTQQFSVSDPYGPYGGGYGGGDGYDDPYADDPYGRGNTYNAGRPAPPPGPRLHWKQLLSGIVLRPDATFWQMRDHPVWGSAITVTFLYGLLAIFGLANARSEILGATLSSAIPQALITAVAVVIAGLILGAVTHTLARQLGGDGAWQPTVGLSMLIMSLTDAPRLLFALFMGGTATLVQVLGWATWVAAGALFTTMVSRSHDLPWPRALGASALQLVALLGLIKLGTL